MATQTGRDTTQPASTPSASGRHASRTPLWIGAAAPVGFLLGFGWRYPRAERARAVAAYASRALDAARLEAALAAAVIAAKSGEYEIGRQRASEVVTGLQRRVLPGATGDAAATARRILGQRDANITALARGDPASAGVLAQTLSRYREGVRQAGLDSAVAPPPVR